MTLLQSSSSGSILFDDCDILHHRKEIRSVLGYLPQDFRFFEKLKTWEFLDYGAGLAGIRGKRKQAEVVDELLRKVGLYEVRDRWANRLSGGMKRRLDIAQAIVGNPKIIIVDEPTTGLENRTFNCNDSGLVCMVLGDSLRTGKRRRNQMKKLISWNVNGLRACLGKNFMEFFDSVDADIFCLQETKIQEGQVDWNPGQRYLRMNGWN